ncbi:amidase, partial [Gammaproteobacteria bacterium]|nr:amidase [Gammaproteobacteria bacterium]
GSIRIPAGTCGLVGYKPPYGRNSDDSPFNLDFYCHTGPLARSVSDAVLLQNVLSGPHPQDIASLRPKLRLPSKYAPIKDWKIAFSMDLGFFEVDPEVRANTLAAVQVFRELGATVDEVDLGWDHSALDAGLSYLSHIFGAYMATLYDDHADDMTTYVREWAEQSKKSTASEFLHTLEVANEMYATLGPILQKYRVLLCPTNALPAVRADFDHSKDSIRINNKDVNPALGWVMTTPFNSLSRCPVLTVPTGRASNGVPTSIQIVGRTYTDKDVFQAGMAYESAAPAWFAGKGLRPHIQND